MFLLPPEELRIVTGAAIPWRADAPNLGDFAVEELRHIKISFGSRMSSFEGRVRVDVRKVAVRHVVSLIQIYSQPDFLGRLLRIFAPALFLGRPAGDTKIHELSRNALLQVGQFNFFPEANSSVLHSLRPRALFGNS